MRKGSLLGIVLAACTLSGCGSNGIAGAALEATGLRKPPEIPDAQKPPRSVALRLHASSKLNLDKRGQPLALSVRLYALRQKDAFEQAPYAAFLDPQAERAALGSDLVAVREIMLVPGQRYEATEKSAAKPATWRWSPCSSARRRGAGVRRWRRPMPNAAA